MGHDDLGKDLALHGMGNICIESDDKNLEYGI
jgi:hypothetical protein